MFFCCNSIISQRLLEWKTHPKGDFMALPKTPWLYRSVDNAINKFSDRHYLNGRKHFAHKLGYDGVNGDIQIGTMLNTSTYNPANPKSMSVDQLAILFEELGPDKKVILDAIAKACDGVFNFNVDSKTNSESLKDELLTIAAFAGNLSSKFLEYKLNDGIIDEDEANELECVAYETRQHLIAFEEMVKKHKKEQEE